MPGMRRREFVSLFGAAATWPMAALAQRPSMPVIGFLSSTSPDTYAPFLSAFYQGLNESGYLPGRSVAIEFRWAEGQYDRLPRLAAELVQRHVGVLCAISTPAAIAAEKATSTIPIVFFIGGDPVKFGLVAGLNRPGGNATGVNVIATELEAKRLGLLRELMPAATTAAVLLNPQNPNAETQLNDVEQAGRAAGWQIQVLNASTERDLEAAFTSLSRRRTDALVITGDTFFATQRNQLVTLAARHAIPAIYQRREYAQAGGLITYGTNFSDMFRQTGSYAGRILKGAKPTDLPIIQPTRFELVINRKTAKILGLQIPDKLLAVADEVIE
jgi:putative tryptophan/tyrosine transport system substrate-binding protein